MGTSYGSDLTFTTTSGVPTPTATSLAANPVSTTTATLNSSVNPNGSSTTIYFQYGLTTSYGSTTTTGNIGTSAGNFGYAISGLTPNTTYHFQVVAYNSGGTSYGGDLTFTTAATTGAPGVTTLAANNVTSVGAQLNGSINPNGSATTAYFEYGTTTAYGTAVGYPRLRSWIADHHGVNPERVLVTNGSMQADAFLFEQLVRPGAQPAGHVRRARQWRFLPFGRRCGL